MAIYHLFINGKYKFKTNSFEEVFSNFSDLEHQDNVISSLIEKHEYHLYEVDGRRKIDIVVSFFGE